MASLDCTIRFQGKGLWQEQLFYLFFFLRGGTVLTNIYSMLTRNTYKTRYVNKTKTKNSKKIC